jgi:hypothetical protein
MLDQVYEQYQIRIRSVAGISELEVLVFQMLTPKGREMNWRGIAGKVLLARGNSSVS